MHLRGCEQGKLITAEARDNITVTQNAGDALGDHPYQLITGIMSVDVVNDLEVIKVDGKHGKRTIGPGCTFKRTGGQFGKETPVR